MGTLLPLPTATDPDFGDFSVTGYRLQADSDVAETFELVVTQGSGRDEALSVQLAVRRALNRELIDQYALRVYATDGDARGASNSGSVDVVIDIVDVNDNKPVFEGSGRYEVTIPEHLPLHTTILRVQAFDEDQGINGQVRILLTCPTFLALECVSPILLCSFYILAIPCYVCPFVETRNIEKQKTFQKITSADKSYSVNKK